MTDLDIVSIAHALLRREDNDDHDHDHDQLSLEGEVHSHGHCGDGNEYDGNDGLRVASIFVILAASALGSYFPVLSSKYSFVRFPSWCFFIAKFFGSGVIVATGFIHLLDPAIDTLSGECLGGTFEDYPWALGICMMSLFSLFFVEIITHHYVHKATHSSNLLSDDESIKKEGEPAQASPRTDVSAGHTGSLPGEQHFGHDDFHQDVEQANSKANDMEKEQYFNQLIALFILEFGIIFHSVLVGLVLAVTASNEYVTLFVVLVFHQFFEGLGLGARIAEAKWSRRAITPWVLAAGFAISTPLATAIGLGVKSTYDPASRTAKIVSGVFDSLSAGILIYTGLVELMAHEFLFSNSFKGEGGFRRMMYGFGLMCLGAGSMALLGRWA
ncbi:HBR116Cp [Eremothecium sinecaudum]|uniref:HBR116Cp n=1 Tax=Eremothecium sinecaudum TaxID=45286 RepID=A0A109UXA7_9SACH|nr:HBR116Cp [Eremothecium sinecaudum]AMD19017.1 HBR116Cp [Eremothecium sinecaudum]